MLSTILSTFWLIRLYLTSAALASSFSKLILLPDTHTHSITLKRYRLYLNFICYHEKGLGQTNAEIILTHSFDRHFTGRQFVEEKFHFSELTKIMPISWSNWFLCQFQGNSHIVNSTFKIEHYELQSLKLYKANYLVIKSQRL